MVERVNGSDGDLIVDYTFTAVAPIDSADFTDITPTDGTVRWSSGDTSAQVIGIELADDGLVE